MRLAAHVTLTDTDDGTVLFDARRGKYWHLNGTGATVVTAVAGGRDVDEVARDISERTGTDLATVASDCRALVTRLRAARLVRG